MALTEVQLPNKTRFYDDLQSIAGEIASRMLRWQQASTFTQTMSAADLDAMGVPAGQIRTDLVEFRIVLNEIVSLYNGAAVTPTYNPTAVMDKIRKMLIL